MSIFKKFPNKVGWIYFGIGVFFVLVGQLADHLLVLQLGLVFILASFYFLYRR
jgi:hypothetical protein